MGKELPFPPPHLEKDLALPLNLVSPFRHCQAPLCHLGEMQPHVELGQRHQEKPCMGKGETDDTRIPLILAWAELQREADLFSQCLCIEQ